MDLLYKKVKLKRTIRTNDGRVWKKGTRLVVGVVDGTRIALFNPRSREKNRWTVVDACVDDVVVLVPN